MRRPERIPIIYKIFRNNPKLFYKFLGIERTDEEIREEHFSYLTSQFYGYWLSTPDLRLGQALYNFYYNRIDFNNVYNKEEDNWLIAYGWLDLEDIKFWTSIYDINGDELFEPRYILLRDLTLDHIKSIKKFFKGRLKQLRPEYLKYFNKRIKDER